MRRFLAITLILAGFACPVLAQEAPWERALNSEHRPSPVPVEDRVDINRASVEELMKVPGMTASWAGRIVRYRPYRTKLDLVDRGVMTPEAFERIRDYVIAHRIKKPDEKKTNAKK